MHTLNKNDRPNESKAEIINKQTKNRQKKKRERQTQHSHLNTYYRKQHPKMNVFTAYVHHNNIQHNNKMLIPGTATKNLTASLWPWKDNCAWAMEQYGVKVAGVTLSVRVLLYTRMTPPGRPPPDEAPPGPLLVPITDCLLPGHREGSVYFQILKTKRLYIYKFCLGLGCLDTDRDPFTSRS